MFANDILLYIYIYCLRLILYFFDIKNIFLKIKNNINVLFFKNNHHGKIILDLCFVFIIYVLNNMSKFEQLNQVTLSFNDRSIWKNNGIIYIYIYIYSLKIFNR